MPGGAFGPSEVVERDGVGGFEWLVLAVGGALFVGVVAVWGGASLATLLAGAPIVVPFGDAASALLALGGNVSDPAAAWGEPTAGRLPGPYLYWCCTATITALLVAVAGVGLRMVGRSTVGTAKRRPLGVDGRARFATRRDLTTLLVDGPAPGRFVLGRFGRRLVATEPSPVPGQPARRLRRHVRRGDRGAVALVGPSRSGKTTAAVGGILEWDGPAVLSSVKSDLLAVTGGWRGTLGNVVVYDPTGTTRVGARAQWSPLHRADTVLGAQRAARALCDAAPRGGVEGGMDFWLAQAEILLSGLLFVARHARRDMGAVCEWVLSQDRPTDLGPGEVRVALDVLLSADDPDLVAGAIDASRGLLAIWELEERTRSSVYATCQTIVWPWSDPEVAASSRGASVDLDWLLGGANTVYLSAPIEDQRRLSPAFGGLLNDLIAQVYRRVAVTGKPLDPPLLIVVDEAGNTPLRALPEYASTLAGLGVLLVTIWQSLAQIEAAYHRQADTILTNHLSKVFYAGLSDAASIRYVSQVLGDAEIETRSRSGVERLGRQSVSLASTKVALAPAHVLRQMRPGDALLVHGTLPPAHVVTRPFYRDRRLSERAASPFPMTGGDR
jgi:type IV secretion system protein VirD4